MSTKRRWGIILLTRSCISAAWMIAYIGRCKVGRDGSQRVRRCVNTPRTRTLLLRRRFTLSSSITYVNDVSSPRYHWISRAIWQAARCRWWRWRRSNVKPPVTRVNSCSARSRYLRSLSRQLLDVGINWMGFVAQIRWREEDPSGVRWIRFSWYTPDVMNGHEYLKRKFYQSWNACRV